MARETYVLRDGQLVPKWEAAPLHAAHGSGPNIISDHLDNVVCPVNGRPYDSKSRYYQAVKDAGCVIAGNDSSVTQPRERTFTPSISGNDVRNAIEQLRAR